MKVEGGKHCIQWRLEPGVMFTITAQLRGGEQQQGTAAPGTRGREGGGRDQEPGSYVGQWGSWGHRMGAWSILKRDGGNAYTK